MKFLVTGGAGFIGSKLVNKLILKNYHVVVIDNFSNSSGNRLNKSHDNLEIIKEDIRNIFSIKDRLNDIDGIFHQAALIDVKESFKKSDEYFDVNVNGTNEVFKLAEKLKVKTILASSSSVYGIAKTIPIKENFQLKPISPYGLTKLENEISMRKFWKKKIDIIALRYFNVFGIGQTPSYAGVITKFLERIRKNESPVIYGTGNQERDFISVDDVAEINMMLMFSGIKKDVFNLGTGNSIKINDLAKIMINISEKKLQPIYENEIIGDIKKSQADITKLKNKTNWNKFTPLKAGLKILFDQ